MADFVGSAACPWGPGGRPRCPPSPGPRAGPTARPGNRKGHTMTEAAVSFAGNLTEDPAGPLHRGWDRPGRGRGGGVGPSGAAGVVLHRRGVARQAEHAAQSWPRAAGWWYGPAPAAESDR